MLPKLSFSLLNLLIFLSRGVNLYWSEEAGRGKTKLKKEGGRIINEIRL